jgi:hypothetical protein
MTPETSSQAAVASVMPRPDADATAIDVVVAIRTVSDLIAAFELHKKYLADHILNNPIRHLGDKAELDRQYDRLSDLEAFIVLSLVWKEACYVTDEDLFYAGLPRRFPDGITRHALGSALQASDRRPVTYDSSAKFARRAGRIVEAAITYALIENGEDECCRANFKPLRATKKLHDILVDIGCAATVIVHAPFAGSINEPSRSGNGTAGAAK